MAEHTNGKLYAEHQSGDVIEIQAENGDPIAWIVDRELRCEDARRLVAAWNFCEGLPLEWLEEHSANTALQRIIERAKTYIEETPCKPT